MLEGQQICSKLETFDSFYCFFSVYVAFRALLRLKDQPSQPSSGAELGNEIHNRYQNVALESGYKASGVRWSQTDVIQLEMSFWIG